MGAPTARGAGTDETATDTVASGGGIFAQNLNTTVRACEIASNRVAGNGGGFFLHQAEFFPLDCETPPRAPNSRRPRFSHSAQRFAAAIMRIRSPKTTALIFASGKMVCTGAKHEEQCRQAARKYTRIIQKLGFPAKFSEFKVQNIVATCDVRFPIRLEGLAFEHCNFASYEPELFPGLIYRMVSPKVVLLIFVSGKLVITGAKNRDNIYNSFGNILPVLQKFRKAS